jgi:hypothetical protein
MVNIRIDFDIYSLQGWAQLGGCLEPVLRVRDDSKAPWRRFLEDPIAAGRRRRHTPAIRR